LNEGGTIMAAVGSAIQGELEENKQLRAERDGARERVRELEEEIERLRDPCAAAGRHVCGPGDAEARIDAALALHFQRYPHGRDNPGFCADCIAPYPCPTVKALKGEK